MKPAKLAVAMARAESMVSTVDKESLKIQNLKQADGSPCDYDPFNMTFSKEQKEKFLKE